MTFFDIFWLALGATVGVVAACAIPYAFTWVVGLARLAIRTDARAGGPYRTPLRSERVSRVETRRSSR